MARISTYIKDNNITREDFVIGSDGDNNNRTSQFSVGALADFIGQDIELDGLPEGTGRIHTEGVHYAPGFDSLVGTDPRSPSSQEFYTGGFYDDGTPDGVFTQPKYPVINIDHNFNTRDVVVFVLENQMVQEPETTWRNINGVLTPEFKPGVPAVPRLVESFSSAVIIIDDNRVQVDLGNIREINATVVVLGPNTDED